MIDLYTWGTPNGRKVSIMLEELKTNYKVIKVDITKKEQFSEEFSMVNPICKIPAIIDHNSKPRIKIFESGAILIYLAEKFAKFLSTNQQKKNETIKWLMYQMSTIGPILGQSHHFFRVAPKSELYSTKRFFNETKKIYSLLNSHLANHEYLSDYYSIADIATFPWIARHEWHKIDLQEYDNVKNWFEKIGLRNEVKRGMSVPFLN